ncbi:UbiA family prenyltransferase [Phenylobacterium aquaticum]|uniref:UbiA family prenyltransferase n=1 Tax=Phenylobacterium aquaticum TaxID=1763816 RepID=UPI0023516D5F|nr:UbiA family prenyltransferase [Phenylobacterium aquaticum]
MASDKRARDLEAAPARGAPDAWARPSLMDWARALRLHQWVKNSLIFVPAVLGGASHSPSAWIHGLLGFFGLGLVASATYVINDLCDLADDRAHWAKRHRPFASGRIPIAAGVAVSGVGLVLGLGLAWMAQGLAALGVVGAYLGLTLSYSLAMKRTPILDVAILATLFTLRLALGVVCAQVVWSAWLLVFSMFLFSSLSFAKRLTEILRLKAQGGDRLPGRGYEAADAPFVQAMGVSLSAAAVLVMVMYLIEEAFGTGLYRTPQLLWTLPLLLALWLGRIWLLCGRGVLDDDPVIFALRDRASLALGGLVALSVLAAALL